MIVRLTHRQWDAVFTRLPEGWLQDWVYEETRVQDDGKKIEVMLLPDVWREIADVLINGYFTTGSIKKMNAPMFDGVRHIVKQTNARQEHPAFRDTAVEGRQFEILPAWELWVPPSDVQGRPHWSPWIPSCDEMGDYLLRFLWPGHSREGGVVITRWHHMNIPATGAISMDSYERFIRARAEAAGSPK